MKNPVTVLAEEVGSATNASHINKRNLLLCSGLPSSRKVMDLSRRERGQGASSEVIRLTLTVTNEELPQIQRSTRTYSATLHILERLLGVYIALIIARMSVWFDSPACRGVLFLAVRLTMLIFSYTLAPTRDPALTWTADAQ